MAEYVKEAGQKPIAWTAREEKIFAQLEELARRYDADKLVLFGSRARRTHEERSDVDLAVYGCSDFLNFSFDVDEKVETLLSFDVVNMDEVPSAELVAEIERDGVTLYEKV